MFENSKKNKMESALIIGIFILVITLIVYYICNALNLGSFCYSSYVDIEQEMLLCQKAIYYDIDSEIVPEYDSSMISGFIQTTSLFRTFFEEQLDSLKKAESVEKIKKL